MQVVTDYEYLTGARGEEVPKEFAVASENSIETFRFLAPTSGLGWDDGIIPYSSLFQTLAEATTNFAHLYSKGDAKCKYPSAILGISVQNLDSFGCPDRSQFRMTNGCSMPCHKFPDKSCALRNACNLYGWLKHHIQEKEYV
jgi:hypothetical protein